MRPIKFRAWDKWKNTMVFADDGMFDSPSRLPGNWKEFLTPLQFTGLSDKNGKEVYQGDILRMPHFGDKFHHHVVEWSDKYSGWYARNTAAEHDDDGSCQLWVYARQGEFEVVGNVFESPE